jgi:hypothetical protein
MGFASAGGFWNVDLRDSMEDCANKEDTAMLREAIARRIACGNLEDKGVMAVDYSVCL